MEEKLVLPLTDVEGEMFLPAAVVSDILRGFGVQWQLWTATGQADLDPGTVAALAEALDDFADQLDVECIALTGPAEQNER